MSATGPDAERAGDAELRQLYSDFASEYLDPLWTQLGDLVPQQPMPKAQPHVWRWSTLYPLAQRAGASCRSGEARLVVGHDLMEVPL